MWHLNTLMGTFWVVENEESQRYYLGFGDEELGVYQDVESIAKDVHNQTTGHFKWDCQSKVTVPDSFSDWAAGEPAIWALISQD